MTHWVRKRFLGESSSLTNTHAHLTIYAAFVLYSATLMGQYNAEKTSRRRY